MKTSAVFLTCWLAGAALAWSMTAVPGTARAAARDGMKADLVIEDVQNLSSNPTRLRIKVANAGHAPAVESRLKVVLGDHNGRQLASRVVVAPLLKAGERQWLVVELDVQLADVRKLAIEIDDLGQVEESDEGNNLHVLE